MSALVLGHPKIPAPLRVPMVDGADRTSPASDNLEEAYRAQITAAMEKEAQRRVTESHDPDEISRLEALSLVELFEAEDADLIPALMARLGPVRAALDGHGGALVVALATIEETNSGRRALSLVIDLDGACVSCGAAPGTLKGIQDDLLMDSEIIEVRFSSAMLAWFDELQRDFVLKHGGVVFV
ncbi:MAG: NifU family protein [Candidatus Thalassarchaeaceae archaeon]|nr:NifU family protein [Candidatus Thalassarchaeaceae archaeon]